MLFQAIFRSGRRYSRAARRPEPRSQRGDQAIITAMGHSVARVHSGSGEYHKVIIMTDADVDAHIRC